MAIQVLGVDGASVLAVDPTFDAAHVTNRPMECLNWQSVGASTGNLTTIAANAAIFSFRNIGANPIAIRRVGVGFVCTTAFTAAQNMGYGLMVARNFTVNDGAGTAISLTGNNCKLRTSLATVTSVDCRISAASIITAGTKTLDINHLAQVGFYVPGVGTALAAAQDNLLSQNTGDYPLVLAQNEGFNIMNLILMGAAGVGTAYVNFEFAEVTSY